MFADLDKLLYLDSDVIIETALDELYNINLQDHFVAAVCDSVLNNTPHYYLEFPDMKPYFNSGVLLINQKLWRENQLFNNFFNMYEKFNFHHQDQDILNIVLKDKWLELPLSYNYQVYAVENFKKRRKWLKDEYNLEIEFEYSQIEICPPNLPHIIHYITSKKPWKNNDCPYKDRFWFYHNLEWPEIIQHSQNL